MTFAGYIRSEHFQKEKGRVRMSKPAALFPSGLMRTAIGLIVRKFAARKGVL